MYKFLLSSYKLLAEGPALQHFTVDPVLNIDEDVYKQAKSMLVLEPSYHNFDKDQIC